jgi:Rhodopirellula transposase DDE domain
MQTDSLWTNLSKEEISSRLEEQGTPASPKIVQQLLDLHDIGRRQAFKNLTMGQHKDRNAQFENIATLKARYLDSLDPLMSIDTKKRELMSL